MRWAWTIDNRSKAVIIYEDGKAFYALFSDGGEGDFCGLGKRAVPTKEAPFWPIKRWRSPRRLPAFARR